MITFICLNPQQFPWQFHLKATGSEEFRADSRQTCVPLCVLLRFTFYDTRLFLRPTDGQRIRNLITSQDDMLRRLSAAPKSVGVGVKETLCSYLYGVKEIGGINGICCSRAVLACNFDFSEFVRRIFRGLVETSCEHQQLPQLTSTTNRKILRRNSEKSKLQANTVLVTNFSGIINI